MKSCPICNKSSQISGHRSNRVRATKFNPTKRTRKYPNLQWARLPAGKAGLASGKRIKICTDCLKKGKYLTTRGL